MRLIALVSGGGITSESRHTTSYLIDTGEKTVCSFFILGRKSKMWCNKIYLYNRMSE
ncbi:hypothetical protein G9F72_011140 [Clostridium estertheticum]|uniref:hypothetical protein n=1 Tax=Clostridium estertheticum TaxID=238834 RepID=UPI0013E95728|nr:hypothetical protein [Clostridium estertheticum]MBZ9686879.1 hypothetical protein [Clostridium estertheticum]